MEESKKRCCCCDDAPEVDTASDTAVPCCCRHKVRSPEEHKALLNRLNRIRSEEPRLNSSHIPLSRMPSSA